MYTRQPLLWYNTTLIGCGRTSCTSDSGSRLILLDRTVQADFYVCRYSPSFYTRPGAKLFDNGACKDETCRMVDSGLNCVDFDSETDLDNMADAGLYCGKLQFTIMV